MSSIAWDEELFSPFAVGLAGIAAVSTVVLFFLLGGATPLSFGSLNFENYELRSLLVPPALAGAIELTRNIVPNGFRALLHGLTTSLASLGFVFMIALLYLGLAIALLALAHSA